MPQARDQDQRNIEIKKPRYARLSIRSLVMTYFHMGKPHTIIGAERFHF